MLMVARKMMKIGTNFDFGFHSNLTRLKRKCDDIQYQGQNLVILYT